MKTSEGFTQVNSNEINRHIERALRKLQRRHPNQARAFRLRVMKGFRRIDVARKMGKHRVETISEWVRKAKEFIRSELPPPEDLI